MSILSLWPVSCQRKASLTGCQQRPITRWNTDQVRPEDKREKKESDERHGGQRTNSISLHHSLLSLSLLSLWKYGDWINWAQFYGFSMISEHDLGILMEKYNVLFFYFFLETWKYWKLHRSAWMNKIWNNLFDVFFLRAKCQCSVHIDVPGSKGLAPLQKQTPTCICICLERTKKKVGETYHGWEFAECPTDIKGLALTGRGSEKLCGREALNIALVGDFIAVCKQRPVTCREECQCWAAQGGT